MLVETAVLVHLALFYKALDRKEYPHLDLYAGRLRNHFYAASLPWLKGSPGRLIPVQKFDEFYDKHMQLREGFPARVMLITLPFPKATDFPSQQLEDQIEDSLAQVSETVAAELEARLVRRLTMLQKALHSGKRFNVSLLDGLNEVIKMGLCLEKVLSPSVMQKLKAADNAILTYSAEEIRQSTSLREELINTCGALL